MHRLLYISVLSLKAGRGPASRGMAWIMPWLGLARQGKAWFGLECGAAWRGRVRLGETGQGLRLGEAGRGMAWWGEARNMAWSGEESRGGARHGSVYLGEPRHGRERDMARQGLRCGMEWRGMARQGVDQGQAWHGRIWHGRERDMARQGWARLGKPWQGTN